MDPRTTLCTADGTAGVGGAPAGDDSLGGATRLLNISRQIERDRLERCWRRDAAQVSTHPPTAFLLITIVLVDR